MYKNKKVIENLFKKKIKLIKEHNKHYFERDNPKVDDAEGLLIDDSVTWPTEPS